MSADNLVASLSLPTAYLVVTLSSQKKPVSDPSILAPLAALVVLVAILAKVLHGVACSPK